MIVIYHLWQWMNFMKHAWLHSDLFQPLNGEYSTVPGFQQWEPEFLSMHGKRMITITELAFIYYISIKSQNVHRCVEYLAHLPIHLHGSLQCHAQLTLYIYIYPFTFIKLHVQSHNYFPKNKHVHSYVLLRIANNGNINLARNIYRLMWSTGKRVGLHDKSCFEIKPLDPH